MPMQIGQGSQRKDSFFAQIVCLTIPPLTIASQGNAIVCFTDADDCVYDAGLIVQQFFVCAILGGAGCLCQNHFANIAKTYCPMPTAILYLVKIVSLKILSFTFHLAELPAGPVERGEQVAGGD